LENSFDDILKYLVSNKVKSIRFSLHGATKETHEAITAMPGSFKRIIDTLHRIKFSGYNIEVGLNIVIHKKNISEIDDMVAIAEKLNVKSISFLRLINYYFANIDKSLLMSKEDTLDALKKINDIKSRGTKIYIHLGLSWGVNFYSSGIWRNYKVQIDNAKKMHNTNTIKNLKNVNFSTACFLAFPWVAIQPETNDLYPCMLLSGSKDFIIGNLEDDLTLNFNKSGRELINRRKNWEKKSTGACSPKKCSFWDQCFGGCRATALADTKPKDGINWYKEFPNCISTLINELL
jgi:radical SAM protein with 4Fe4S-binding SPASM domain